MGRKKLENIVMTIENDEPKINTIQESLLQLNEHISVCDEKLFELKELISPITKQFEMENYKISFNGDSSSSLNNKLMDLNAKIHIINKNINLIIKNLDL